MEKVNVYFSASLLLTLSLLRGLILSGALVYLLPVLWGIDGVWWAMVITESVVVVFAVMGLRKADKDGLQGLKK